MKTQITSRDQYQTVEDAHAEALDMDAEFNFELVSREINISDLPCMDEDRYQWLKNRWAMFWGACDHASRTEMVDEAHTEALEMNYDYDLKAEQAAERMAPDYALAQLMNKHMETLPVGQVISIFAKKPALAAHLECNRLRIARIEADELNAHIEAFLPNAPERKVLTAYAANIK